MKLYKNIIDENVKNPSMGKTELWFYKIEGEEKNYKLIESIDEHIYISLISGNPNIYLSDQEINIIRSELELDFKDSTEKSYVIFYHAREENQETIKKIFQQSQAKLGERFTQKYIFMSDYSYRFLRFVRRYKVHINIHK